MRIDDAADLLGVSSNVLSRLENDFPVGSDRLWRALERLGHQASNLPICEHINHILNNRDARL